MNMTTKLELSTILTLPRMVSVCKLGGTINQTGVKGGKSKRWKIPPRSLSFSFSPRPRFSRLAVHHSPLVRLRDVRSIALKTLGKWKRLLRSPIFFIFFKPVGHGHLIFFYFSINLKFNMVVIGQGHFNFLLFLNQFKIWKWFNFAFRAYWRFLGGALLRM